MDEARAVREARSGRLVTYSPKVFIPLTKLCRDVCHYCTFARPPRRGERAYLRIEEVLEVARAGERAGCREALFTLGDKPERRYRAAREELAALGFATTLEYLAEAARTVLEQTSLLPHLNPGVLTAADFDALRPVAGSMGLMLETTAVRLSERGGPHFGSPDKAPAARLETLRLAGEAKVPFTTGILIGIGETREERLDALRAIASAGPQVQEVIVQNFRAKHGTRMAQAPEPQLEELLWTIAVARLILPAEVAVQAPPNLTDDFARLLDAGIDDWGGVSPVTIDHVNPEAAWPELELLRAATESRGLELAPRLTVHPGHIAPEWIDPAVLPRVLRASDSLGLAREDPWSPGETGEIPFVVRRDILPLKRVTSSARTRSRACSVRAARSGSASSPPRTRCAVRSTATRSPTSSRGTSSTRTSATSAAASAPSRRGSSRRTSVGSPTSSRTARSSADASRRGIAAPPRSASRAASTRRSTATTTSRSSARSRTPCRSSTCTRSARSRSGRAPRRLACRSGDYLERLRDEGLASLPGTAAEVLDDEVRAVDLPRQDHERPVARGAPRPHTSSACARTTRSCSATSTGPGPGRVTCRASASCSARRAASPSSCRFRSCTWRRRST